MKHLRGLLAAVLLLCLSGCSLSQGTMQTQKPYVAVIAKSTNSSFWKSVQAGANAAASEYNLEFTFDGPFSEEDYNAQNSMIADAVAQGARAIVLSAIDYAGSAEAVDAAAAAGVSVVVIDSDVDSDRVAARIGTDNYAAGMAAAQALLDTQLETLTIGVVNFDEHTRNGQEREQGFCDGIAADPRAEIVEILHIDSDSNLAIASTRDLLFRRPEINAIATFNEITTLGVGHAIEASGLRDAVYVVGFDSNIVSVGMLETGEIDALVVQNPFAMGYLGVETAASLIAGRTPADPQITTEARVIDRAAMYTEENQKLLFSFTENLPG